MEIATLDAHLRGLKALLLLGEISLLLWLAATEGVTELGVILLVVVGGLGLVAVFAYNWPVGAISILIISSAMPRLSISVLGLHLRPEHVSISVAALAIWIQVRRRLLPSRVDLRKFDYLLFAFIAINFFTSAFTSPEPRLTLRWAVLNAIIISPFFILRFLIRDIRRLYKAVDVFLMVGVAESAYGVLCFLSNQMLHTKFGVEAEQYGSIPATYGTQYEANIFGSYAACCTIAFLAFFLLGRDFNRVRYGWGLAITLLGSLASMARSVLLALPVAAFFVFWMAFKTGRVRLRTITRLSVVLAIILVAISPILLKSTIERFSSFDASDLTSDNTTLTRLVQLAAGLEDVRTHPILGTGTASFQLLFDWNDYMPGMGGENEVGGWLSNTALRILHDTGVIGLMIFLAFVYSLVKSLRRAFHVAEPELKTMLIALSSGLVLYAITFQATEATILAFTWIHFGLLAAIVDITSPRAGAAMQ